MGLLGLDTCLFDLAPSNITQDDNTIIYILTWNYLLYD